MKTTVNAQVHRLGPLVAVYIGTGATAYITAKQARLFARAINKAAKSVETEPFVNSNCSKSFTFEREI